MTDDQRRKTGFRDWILDVRGLGTNIFKIFNHKKLSLRTLFTLRLYEKNKNPLTNENN